MDGKPEYRNFTVHAAFFFFTASSGIDDAWFSSAIYTLRAQLLYRGGTGAQASNASVDGIEVLRLVLWEELFQRVYIAWETFI